jgi:hypothetical protein
MYKFFSKSAVLIFLALSIEPASARMCCGANSRPFSFQHQGFRSTTFSPYRPGGQKYLPAQSVRNFSPQSTRNLPAQSTRNTSQQSKQVQRGNPDSNIEFNFPQSPVNPHGPSGSPPQGTSQSPQGGGGASQRINYSPQGSGVQPGGGYAPQGGSYDQPQGVSNSPRVVRYCTISGGDTCQTLSPLGSYCECRDNYGRHFRGVVK